MFENHGLLKNCEMNTSSSILFHLFLGNLLVYKSEPRVRRVVPSLDGDNPESDGLDGGTELDDSINSSTMSKNNNNSDNMSNDVSVQTKSSHKKKSRSKPKGLTIDIPSTNDKSQMSTLDEQTDEIDFHEYVNLVDCQRYREEMSRSTNVIGSNPVLHFPNVIGYASTQHILALYGNPRTPLLPDHYAQQQVPISSTFYARIFLMKVVSAAFL